MCLYVFIDVFICLFICLFIIYLFLHVSTIFYFHCIWHKTHATLWLWAKCSDQRVCVQKNMGTAGLRWVIKFHQQQTKGISSTAPPGPHSSKKPRRSSPKLSWQMCCVKNPSTATEIQQVLVHVQLRKSPALIH